MRKNRQRLIDYLQHMQEAVLRIQKYIGNCDENTFIGNELVQDAVIRNLEVIGEASQNINKFYPEYIKENESIPFLAAYEMRNALAHGYFKVDLEIVWITIKRDIPELEVVVKKAINDLEIGKKEGKDN